MKVFAIDKINPGVMHEQVQPYLKQEAKTAWQLYKSEVFRELYFRADHPGVVIVMECDSVDEARKALSELPLVKENLIEFELIPVGYFSPFEGLFAKD